MYDFRAAELISGQAKFRDFELDETTPKKPTNINDSDLYPAMPQAAVESTKPTEMMWCILRFELFSSPLLRKRVRLKWHEFPKAITYSLQTHTNLYHAAFSLKPH